MKFKAAKQPDLRDESTPWEQAAPGLYDDGEVLLRLDDGTYVAVSVLFKWLGGESGGGAAFEGTARWCDENGETHLTPDGRHVETFSNLTVDGPILEKFGREALSQDVLLLLLGEDPKLILEAMGDDGKPSNLPVLNPPPSSKLAANIRFAINAVEQSKKSLSAKELLGV